MTMAIARRIRARVRERVRDAATSTRPAVQLLRKCPTSDEGGAEATPMLRTLADVNRRNAERYAVSRANDSDAGSNSNQAVPYTLRAVEKIILEDHTEAEKPVPMSLAVLQKKLAAYWARKAVGN